MVEGAVDCFVMVVITGNKVSLGYTFTIEDFGGLLFQIRWVVRLGKDGS